jgi:twinkle protein
MVVLDLTTKKEYEVLALKQGENPQTCPVCSPERKKKLDKCFSFNLAKGAGKCSHCGVVLVEKKDFIQKPTKIAFKRPLFKSSTNYSPDLIKFFSGRKISEKTLLDMKVGEGMEWMPQINAEVNTIQFNYFRNGELINIKYRGKNKSFKLEKGGELIFYNLDCSIHNNTIIIVEGEMDCLALYECGFKNVVSVPNGAGLGKINFDYLDNSIDSFSEDTQFILAVDNDQAGQNLQNELARRLGYENCTYVRFKDCKDANDCLIKYGIQGVTEAMNSAKEFPIEGVFNANDIEDEIYSFYNNGLPKGCGIGMAEIDMLIRFQEGYLTTITGIPGHGKSEFLDFILCKLNVSHEWKTALYSPENHPLELHFSKFAEKITGKPFEGVNRMSPADLRQMIDYHAKNFFFINPKENFTLDNILDSVRSLVRKKGIKAFVIDAWNKLDHQYATSETKYISEQLDKIVMFCERNKVHCFLVAHPTKISKNRDTQLYEIPNLYSISGSANFYNKTANGLTVYRNYETGQTQVYIQKVKFKHWGQTGCVDLRWDSSNGRYFIDTPNSDNWINMMPNRIQENTEFLTAGTDIITNSQPLPF